MIPIPHIFVEANRSPAEMIGVAASAITTMIPTKIRLPPQVGVGLISRVRCVEVPRSLVCFSSRTASSSTKTGVTAPIPLTYCWPVLILGR